MNLFSTVIAGNYFRGPVQCARSILQQKGPLGLYRGLPIMLPRDGPTYGIYMITYEWMNDVLRDQWALTGFTACAISGGIAGSTCWFCAMPFDVLKSKQQAAVLNEQPLSVRYVSGAMWGRGRDDAHTLYIEEPVMNVIIERQ